MHEPAPAASLVGPCEAICHDVERFYRDAVPRLGHQDFGYKVLYGPPIANPPFLFVGFQPGGGAEEKDDGRAAGFRPCWPDRNEYAIADWRLARQIRDIWPASVLSGCVATNSIFFRAPSKAAWGRLPASVRRELTAFSRGKFEQIVEIIRPRRIVAFGFGHLAGFVPGEVRLVAGGRRLAQLGHALNIPAVEVIHLSGARINRSNRRDLAVWLHENVPVSVGVALSDAC